MSILFLSTNQLRLVAQQQLKKLKKRVGKTLRTLLKVELDRGDFSVEILFFIQKNLHFSFVRLARMTDKFDSQWDEMNIYSGHWFSGWFSFYSNYSVRSFLGKGGFGYVVKAENIWDHRSYAVKWVHLQEWVERRQCRSIVWKKDFTLNCSFSLFRNNEQNTLGEVLALTKLKHVNIVGYVNAWKENSPRDWIKQKEDMLDGGPPEQEDDVDEGHATSKEITSE